jgi:hypothetical protein
MAEDIEQWCKHTKELSLHDIISPIFMECTNISRVETKLRDFLLDESLIMI